MTQTMEATTEKKLDALEGFSLKPKPAVSSGPSHSVQGNMPRRAPFETYMPTDSANGIASTALPAWSGVSSTPVAKKRLINIFPVGTTNH